MHYWSKFAVALFAATLTASGCAGVQGTPARDRVIIQFVAEVEQPDRASFIGEASQVAEASLRHERQLATGAHLFTVNYGGQAPDLENVLKRLRNWKKVIYAEPDRRTDAHSRTKPAIK